MHIEVVYALPAHQHRIHLELAENSKVSDALNAVARIEPFRSLLRAEPALAVYGKIVQPDQQLSPGDRVEILRPLLMDPKEARRRRAEAQTVQPELAVSAAASVSTGGRSDVGAKSPVK